MRFLLIWLLLFVLLCVVLGLIGGIGTFELVVILLASGAVSAFVSWRRGLRLRDGQGVK